MAAETVTDPDDCPPEEDPTPTPTGEPGEPTTQDAGGTLWDSPNQQVVRADHSGPGIASVNAATGASAGVPGAWTPGGSVAPASVANLQAGNPRTVTASPTTTWTVGQYVQTTTAGVPGRAYWHATNGWVSGAAP
jgi:hypothetical protein